MLSYQQIKHALAWEPPLLQGYVDLETQLQPNGFDLSLAQIARFLSPGRIGPTNQERVLSRTGPLPFDSAGWLRLSLGAYLVTFNEAVHLPRHLMALGRPRSSLLRCGVTVHNAVWDAGYSGRSQALLVVYNPDGVELARNARVIQLVFLTLGEATEVGYGGRFQGENLR